MHWRPNAAWAWPVTLPFETIIGIRVVDTGRWDKLICYPEIAWRSCTGRVRKTRLPISEDLKGVQEVVARLQVAVFGTTSPVTDGPRQRFSESHVIVATSAQGFQQRSTASLPYLAGIVCRPEVSALRTALRQFR